MRLSRPTSRALARVASALAIGGALAALLRPQTDPDLWWHLLVAEQTLGAGRPPSSEVLSWWAQGAPWFPHGWAGELVLLGAYRAAGLVGTALAFLPVWALLLGGVLAAARASAAGRTRTGLLASILVLVFAGYAVWSPRLQVLDSTGLALLLAVLARERAGLPAGRARALYLGFLPLWANGHGGGILLGPAALALWGAGLWLERREGRAIPPLRGLAALGAVSAGLALFNPAGPALLAYPFEWLGSEEFRNVIREWGNPDLGEPLWLPLRLLVAGGLLVAGAHLRRRWAPLALVAATGFLALASIRFAAPYAVVLAALVAPPLASETGRLAARSVRGLSAGARRAIVVATPAVTLAVIACSVGAVALGGLVESADEARFAERYFPVRAAALLAPDAGCGRLWNEYDWGGYLAWRWRVPVGAYGASDALGPGRLATYRDLTNLRIDPLAFLERERVAAAVLASGRALARHLALAPGWRTNYDDGSLAVLVRTEGPCAAAFRR